jgi:hypothetical protein
VLYARKVFAIKKVFVIMGGSWAKQWIAAPACRSVARYPLGGSLSSGRPGGVTLPGL